MSAPPTADVGTGRSSAFETLPRGSLVVAFAVVQLVAFAATYTAGIPTVYAGFALLSVFGAAVAANEGVFGVTIAVLGSVLLLAVGLPLAMFVARQRPSLILERALDPDVHRMLYLSVYAPLLAALVSVIFGVPLALALSRGFPGRTLVASLVDLPLVVPHSAAGIIVLFGFGRGGAFPQLTVLGTVTGVVLAMVFVSAPYAVNSAREAFEAVDDRLEYASRIHGASRFETFRRVTGPLAVRGIVTGGVLAWARSVSEFGAVAIVAYSVRFFYPPAGREVTSQHAPVFIRKAYLTGGLDQSGAVTFLLLLVSTAVFLIIRWLAADTTRTGGIR
ncbi:ABC transporter permease [Halogeometricum borinquense]|uniref:ABC transporter permease n=1 Tax=Halogeometricum borinquense TaxID=60847 RepID=A0A6C0UH12_9EURY|nr:ABC transporter permease [Halogeometricum borinquense]QIB73863.1 ABC transporter permease [Halogeometricum borinquense]QIQ76775.1 ABC transporter permease [Halogeometricum borinquense]